MFLKKMFQLFLVMTILGSATQCKNRDDEKGSDVKHIYGKDNRVPVKPKSDTFLKSVGAITVDNKVACTGSLVGVRLVLTTNECVPHKDFSFDNEPQIHFVPQANLGPNPEDIQKMLVIDASFGGFDPQTEKAERIKDWAILVLEHHPIDMNGNPLPFLKLSDITPETDQDVQMASMAKEADLSKTFLQLQEKCTIKHHYESDWPGVLLHNCDSESGSAGAPLFVPCDDQLCIIALQVSAMTPGHIKSADRYFSRYYHMVANIALSHKIWAAAIKALEAKITPL